MSTHKPLEANKIFPYLAWLLTISFAFFVYSLVLELRKTQEAYSATTMTLENQVSSDPLLITDFSR